MSLTVLYILTATLIGLLICIYIFIILSKIMRSRSTKQQARHMLIAERELNELMSAFDADYPAALGTYTQVTRERVKRKAFRSTVEAVLLEHLQSSNAEDTKKLLAAAYALGFPPACLPQIKKRSNRSVSYGSRKAGLYRYKEAVPFMLDALSLFSSDTQFQILMGLSRIGDVDAMQRAFEKIERYVVVNERSVFEIMGAFNGDKRELCKRMIYCVEDYISALFLKSFDKDIATALSADVIGVIENGGKEARIAAIKAIARTGDGAYSRHLLQAMEDRDWEVRAVAAKALGTLIDPAAHGVLADAVYDSEWWVRQNAAAALLHYPDYERIFTEVMASDDGFAKDSVIFVLESAQQYDLINEVTQAAAQPLYGVEV